jgi:hypothetical protein
MILMSRRPFMGVLVLMIMGMAMDHIPVPVLMLVVDLPHCGRHAPTAATSFAHTSYLLC